MDSNNNIVWIGLGILAAVALVFWLLPTGLVEALLYIILFFGSIFLVLLVLIQRGRGGGLAGALGGMGGYSAFGTRAGDIFTRITIIAAALWILSAMALVKINSSQRGLYDEPGVAPKPDPAGIEPATVGGAAGDESKTEPEPSGATEPTSAPPGDAEPAAEKKAEPGEPSQP